MRVLIVGAGVIGVSTAWALVQRGVEVVLIDAADEVASGASHANGGQLSWSYTEPLASPAILREMPRLLAGLDPAFRLRPSADPALAGWLLRFLRQCTAERSRTNLLDLLRLGLHSREVMAGWSQTPGLDFSQRRAGKLRLFATPEALRQAAARIADKQSLGVEEQLLDVDACREREPALAHWRGAIAGGLWDAQAAVGDAQAFTRQLAAMAQRAGVTLHLGTRSQRMRLSATGVIAECGDGLTIQADQLVLCAGVHSAGLARSMGARLPIQPMQGYSLTLPRGPNTPSVGLTDAANRMVYCRLGDRLRIAGVAELGRSDAVASAVRVEQLLDCARRLLPDAADYDADPQAWAGVRPMTPDGLPLIGELRPRLWANTGHGMLGWTMAAGSADLLAALICGASPAIPTGAYRPFR